MIRMAQKNENIVEDIVFDDGDRIEIASSHPDVESAIKTLHESM